jgi:hypothetical protein
MNIKTQQKPTTLKSSAQWRGAKTTAIKRMRLPCPYFPGESPVALQSFAALPAKFKLWS